MSDGVDTGRRRFLRAATAVGGLVGAAAAMVPFVASWSPSAKAQAAGAPVEVDISKLEPGTRLVVEWRGKPIWVVRRTEESLKILQDNTTELRDPNSVVDQQPSYAQNEYRSLKPEYMVLVGVCTHLGCSPNFRPELGSVDSSWKGGFFCPCHGSKFDLAGRVFRGVPAPVNLEVPPYSYADDTTLLIGVDAKEA